jgi:hypothetical protein
MDCEATEKGAGAMKLAKMKRARTKGLFIKPMRLTARGTALLLSILIGVGLLTAVVGAYSRGRFKNSSSVNALPPPTRLVQPPGGTQIKNLFGRLSLQPEADRFRRRLGQRFLTGGEERSVLTGTLTVGGQRYEITMVRTQSDDGEQVEIGLDGQGTSLTWNPALGTQAANGPSRDERSMTERLALDSPDQFIHAQLRMASYYTIARNVMPAEAGGADNYSGPVWDVVRVTEPTGGHGTPLSLVRHYFFNSLSGLLEKVVSDEEGRTIVAQISEWSDQSGELLPAHIVWSNTQEMVMELTVKEFSIGPAE